MGNVKTLIFTCLLLGGCTVGPDYAGPPPLGHSAPPPSFVRQPGSVASAAPALADWWTAFNDPVLNDLEKRALAANPSIEAAQARISQARASVRQERANLFPTAGAQATAIFADLPGLDLQSNQGNQSAPTDSASAGNQDNSLSFFNLGLNANWEIDLAGGQRRKIEAANARAAAAVFHAADAQVQLTAEVAQSYINLRERQQRADELRRSREIQQQLLDLTGQRGSFRQPRHHQIPHPLDVSPNDHGLEASAGSIRALRE